MPLFGTILATCSFRNAGFPFARSVKFEKPASELTFKITVRDPRYFKFEKVKSKLVVIYLYYMENGTAAIILIYKSLRIFSFLKVRACRLPPAFHTPKKRITHHRFCRLLLKLPMPIKLFITCHLFSVKCSSYKTDLSLENRIGNLTFKRSIFTTTRVKHFN